MYIILDSGSITQIGFMKEPEAIPPRESFNIPFIEWAEKGNSQGLHKNLFIEHCNGERLDAHTASVAISKNCNFTSGGHLFPSSFHTVEYWTKTDRCPNLKY